MCATSYVLTLSLRLCSEICLRDFRLCVMTVWVIPHESLKSHWWQNFVETERCIFLMIVLPNKVHILPDHTCTKIIVSRVLLAVVLCYLSLLMFFTVMQKDVFSSVCVQPGAKSK